MQSHHLGNYRIARQSIGTGKFRKAADVVAHLGAMQAQDFAMARFAIGVRTRKQTEHDVLAAYNRGDILRTHVLRPTWHFVTPADADWMIRLSAPRILGLMPGRRKQLKLTDAVFRKSNRIIEKAVTAKPQTREGLVASLREARIIGIPEIYSHLLFRAELDRVIISGPITDNRPTYAPYADRVKKTTAIPHEEALARLAERYFTSHGPASIEDFIWWSGLRVGDARIAVASVEKKFNREKIGETTYLLHKSARTAPDSVYLLPAFDEFLIGYADRTAVLTAGMSARVASVNGIFYPTIVANGIVIGTWKREIKKGKLVCKPEYFGKPDRVLRTAVDEKGQELAAFLGLG
ncbi:MAG: winged helix DNA-binding domain-containing protein [Spirochaetia bacterium]|nr:winged helix DNA-binding domain-containing protein [Spirochaetia bacterium]